MLTPGRVLVVCTANVCRSPTAVLALRRALEGAGWLSAVDVSSAGTRARPDFSICEMVYTSLDSAQQQSAEAHRSRQVTADILDESDLVLTLEKEHRSTLAQLSPQSRAKTFTLTEAAALARGAVERGSDAPRSVTQLAETLNGLRGIVIIPEKPKSRWSRQILEPLTILDGHGQSERKHRAAIDETSETADRLADAILDLTGERRSRTAISD